MHTYTPLENEAVHASIQLAGQGTPGLDEKSVWPKGQSERALDEREKNEEPGERGEKRRVK